MKAASEHSHKLCIWMNMPSHHQRGFLDAICASGVDLQVFYYGQLSQYRKDMGWGADQLQSWEQYIDREAITPTLLSGFHDHVHIVPGYRDPSLRKLIRLLVRNRYRWLHWSEPAQRFCSTTRTPVLLIVTHRVHLPSGITQLPIFGSGVSQRRRSRYYRIAFLGCALRATSPSAKAQDL